MRRLGLGMLVRHHSFTDKDLLREKWPLAQRNHRHSGFSQSSQVNPHQHSTLRVRGRWVGWRFPGRARWEQEEALAAPELTTADTSGLQAVNGLGVVREHNLTENRDAVSRFSDYFSSNLFLLLIKQLSTCFMHTSVGHSLTTLNSGLLVISMTFPPDPYSTVRLSKSLPSRQSGTSDMSSWSQKRFCPSTGTFSHILNTIPGIRKVGIGIYNRNIYIIYYTLYITYIYILIHKHTPLLWLSNLK